MELNLSDYLILINPNYIFYDYIDEGDSDETDWRIMVVLLMAQQNEWTNSVWWFTTNIKKLRSFITRFFVWTIYESNVRIEVIKFQEKRKQIDEFPR